MKAYKEVAESVLHRSEVIQEENRRKKKRMVRWSGTVTLACTLILMGSVVLGDNNVKQEVVISENENSDITVNIQSSVNTETTTLKNSESGVSDTGNGIMIPDSSNFVPSKIKTIISSYGDKNTPEGCYSIPENGKYAFSVSLKGALEEYSDSVEYRVVVFIFNNQQEINLDSDSIKTETDRLFRLGYTPALERYNDGENEYNLFTLVVPKEKLTMFAVDKQYGYMFFLYDEVTQWIR